MTKREQKLLAEIEQALDDWIVTYAADHCRKKDVRAAWKRLMGNGGTIAYVTDLRERVHAALKGRCAKSARGLRDR
jgi:hypothetical protein